MFAMQTQKGEICKNIEEYMENPRFMARIAVEEGVRICDKLTKKPSRTNHPAILFFFSTSL